MGHRQQMNDAQRLDWDVMQYKKRLESQKGSNYAYWNTSFDNMLDNGWELVTFVDRFKNTEYATSNEDKAKAVVKALRSEEHFARIVCGYSQNKQRIKMYSVIYKKKL